VVGRSSAGTAWAQRVRLRGWLIAASAGLAALAGVARDPAPRRDLDALAAALGRAAGGARVAPVDIRWEPSGGLLADAVVGRWALFLASGAGDDTRDVWRARVRVTPEGGALDVGRAYDLTSTPLGDDHELVLRGTRAAFATRAYGQEQTVTLLSLAGEGEQNKTSETPDRIMAAITNLQRTGSAAGVGRLDVTLESPARAVGLALGDDVLAVTFIGGDARRAPSQSEMQVDLASGDLVRTVPGIRTGVSVHLPKRFSHWAVDTARAVSWIGPAPIAWAEDQALSARDAYRRFTYQPSRDATDLVAAADPPPPVLDTSEASLEEAHWPPARIQTIWQSPEPGEGEWVTPDIPWLRRAPGVADDAPSAFYRTFVRPDEDRPYAKVLLVAMDMRRLELRMEAGVEDPEPLTGPPGTGRIPRDPATYRRVAAAFNGAFKTEHGRYGMMVHRRVLLPPLPGAATVIVLDDGRVGFGTWGADRKVGGIAGVSDDEIDSFRQNLDPLIDRGVVNPTGRNLWGFTLPGKGVQTERTGLCVTMSGHLLYAWGDDVSATSLARAMKMAGCDYAMHLDMNPYHTGFLFTAIDDLSAKNFRSALLTTAMSIPVDRYIQYAPKDFFYVTVRDARPTPVDGAAPWRADGGVQPPPQWMPGVWTTRVDGATGSVELIEVEPGRATWRIRAGIQDATAAAPLRELGGEEGKRVLFALGMGIAHEKRPFGLATDGRLAVTIRGGPGSGLLVVGEDGRLSIDSADDAPLLGAHDDLVELPLLSWDGQSVAAVAGASAPRAAIGATSDGRILVARGSFPSAAPLAEALARAGCTRALALDRGLHATALLDRAGTGSPPRARYEESVLFAVGTPLRPHGFRFDASAPYALAGKSK
jgi:hypothetical protein